MFEVKMNLLYYPSAGSHEQTIPMIGLCVLSVCVCVCVCVCVRPCVRACVCSLGKIHKMRWFHRLLPFWMITHCFFFRLIFSSGYIKFDYSHMHYVHMDSILRLIVVIDFNNPGQIELCVYIHVDVYVCDAV